MKAFILLWTVLVVCVLFRDAAGIWPCLNNNDCSFIVNAICSPSNSCRCPVGYVLSGDQTKCLKASLYGAKCEESVQCSHMLSGANCNKGVCECNDGHTYIRGRCKVLNGLGESCKEDTDCWFGYDKESVTCDKQTNKCRCADNYYERYINLCRRKSMGVNQPCLVDEDCSFIKENGIRCEDQKCVLDKRRSSKDIGVQTSFDIFQLNPVPEVNEENVDDEEEIELTVLSPETDAKSKIGDKCTQNGNECKGLPHSVCIENLCYCKPGYYQKENKCMAELGETADSAEFCEGPKLIYNSETKKCACDRAKKLEFAQPDLRSCKKFLVNFTAPCTSTNQCSPYGAAFCNTQLERKQCMCEVYASYNEKTQLCEHKSGLGGYCDATRSCTIPYSICSKQKQCVCKENFAEKDGKCMPAIGGECSRTEDCAVEHSECKPPKNSTQNDKIKCKCQKGYVQHQDNCVKEASEFGEECVDSEQCKPLLGELGKCINKTCICEEHHHLSFGKCEEKKAIGEACSKSSECFTPEEPKSTECRNSVCRCQLGYTTDIEKQICIKPKKNSSGRPSVLKVITFLLIGSAVLITSAAIKQAYY